MRHQCPGLLAATGFISAWVGCTIDVAWAVEASKNRITVAQTRETKTAAASGSGVIREIDRANSRIRIDHGPIPSISMPGMVMTFKVKHPQLLDGLKQGDVVNFEIERSGLGWIIMKLHRKQGY